MYLIAIPTATKFDTAKALYDSFECGTLTEPAKSWSIVGSAHRSTDARVMAQAIANERRVTVEIRAVLLHSGSHYLFVEIEPKPEPKPADEPVIIGGADIDWEPYDGVPADTLPEPDLDADTF